MSTQRWTFVDTVADETWTVPINPKSATSPFPAKVITTAQGADLDSRGIHRTRMFQAPSAPVPWEFGGLIRSKAHHDELHRWAEKDNEVQITDHLGRTFEVLIRQFEPVEQRPTKSNDWRMTYTMRVLVLRRIRSTPA